MRVAWETAKIEACLFLSNRFFTIWWVIASFSR